MLNLGDFNDYLFIEDIGSGAFASVYRAMHKPTKRMCAVKAFSKQSLQTPNEYKAFLNEINIAKYIDHPLITTAYEIFENKTHFFFSMELVDGNSLLNFINESDNGVDENTARKIFIQLVIVIDFLHNNLNVIHRDLKSENVLLDKFGNIRLIDFGLSKMCEYDSPMLKTLCGSPAYAAPELLQGVPYGYPADIWSAGVILYAMVAGYLPFDDNNIPKQIQSIITKEPIYPTHLNPILIDLMKRMLVKDPEKRITISQLKEHPWISQSGIIPPTSSALRCINLKSIDQDVLSVMKDLSIDTSGLAEDLLNNVLSRSSASYKIIREEKVTNMLRNIFSTKRRHRYSSVIENDQSILIPALEKLPNKLSALKNHPNSLSTPENTRSRVLTNNVVRRPGNRRYSKVIFYPRISKLFQFKDVLQ